MKKFNLIWLFVLLHNTDGSLLKFINSQIPECISVYEMYRITEILCHEQRHNRTLWKEAIACHRPISDEFLRSRAEALCPNPKFVQDPSDEKYSLEDVFFNICGTVDGNIFQVAKAGLCISFGTCKLPSHVEEVNEVKTKWGQKLPCKIGKCFRRMGWNLGI